MRRGHRSCVRALRLLSYAWLLAGAAFGLLSLPEPAKAQAGVGAPRTININVRVTAGNHENPINLARVELLKFPDGILLQAFTDNLGQVEFSRVVAHQSYIVRVSKEGYAVAELQFDTLRGESMKRVNVPLQRLEPREAVLAGDTVSVQQLAVPPPAIKEFTEGMNLLRERNDPKRSLRHFERAIALFPSYAEAFFMLGMAHLQLNDSEQAQAALEKARELNPKALEPYYPLAVLLVSQKRYDEAERLLLQAMGMDQQDWKWPFELARCYGNSGQWEKALKHGQMAHDRPNAPSKVHILMADLYSSMGNREKALEELEKFAKMDPASPFMPRVQEMMAQLRKN